VEANATTVFPLTMAGAINEMSPATVLLRREDTDDARRLRDGEVEVRRRDGVYVAEQLLILVCPSRVVNQAVNRRRDFFLCIRRARAMKGDRINHLRTARFDHLREPVNTWPRL